MTLTTNVAVRLGKWQFPWLAAGCLVCCLIGRDRLALLSAAFLVGFLLAVVGMCCYELPLRRYLELAEWYVLVALMLGVLDKFLYANAGRVFFERKKKEIMSAP